jgi:uncharacterized membrane protein YgcG
MFLLVQHQYHHQTLEHVYVFLLIWVFLVAGMMFFPVQHQERPRLARTHRHVPESDDDTGAELVRTSAARRQRTGNGNGNGNGQTGNGNGGNGQNTGETYLAADVRKMPDGKYGVYADKFKNK